MVRPQFSKISSFCIALTNIRQKDVEGGVSFNEACKDIQSRYSTKRRTWASWGDYDRKQFERQCADFRFDTKYPFGPTHLNIKNLFAIHYGLRRECSVIEALRYLNWEFEGNLHRGGDDAHNIARIFKSMAGELPEKFQ